MSALALSLWASATVAHAADVPEVVGNVPASPASAASSAALVPQACIFEGTIPVEGRLERTKDCYQNDGLSPEDFQFLCDSMARMAKEATKEVGTHDAQMSTAASCPAGAYGRCDRFINRPVLAFFYKRSKRDLEATRESCYTQGGHWNELPAASRRPATKRKTP